MDVTIEGVEYRLELDSETKFVSPDFNVAYNDELADNYKPIIFNFKREGQLLPPPEFIAYRIVVDNKEKQLCVLYEVYWKKQDCDWRGLNKDHDHDYERIQLHFNLNTGKLEKVVVSSGGPIESGGHGVELYSYTTQYTRYSVDGITSSKDTFPWGPYVIKTQIQEWPISNLLFREKNPVVKIIACYHVFTGVKVHNKPSTWNKEETNELELPLKRLDQGLLEQWYYRHTKNRFGHDVSNPFQEPYLLYCPPPEDIKSRIFYGLLWIYHALKKVITGQ